MINNEDGNQLTKNKIISKCDRWIGFFDTLSKGKKNDHVAHHALLDYILSWHKTNNEINFNEIKCINVRADNCSTQHKCRQNFYRTSLASTKHGVSIIHKFAQKYGFKGPWGGTSKLIKQTISKLEMKHARAANANDC